MMIARIRWNENGKFWYCNECKVRQPGLRETCVFCGSLFTNFEDEMVRANRHMEDESTETFYPEKFIEKARKIVR